MMKMLVKEIRELLREPWLCGAVFCLMVLLGWQLVRWENFYDLAQTRLNQKQAEAREDWLTQPSPSAHMATHHGTTLYKVLSPLAGFDPGVDRLLGTELKLESHRQHRMLAPLVAEVADPLQFDISSPAMMVQALFPLFMILVGFSAVSRERELGTLPLILSTGVSWRKFIASKLGLSLLMSVLLISPVILLFFSPAPASMATSMEFGQGLGRSLLLLLCCLLFLAGWGFLAVAISARAASSRVALIILLALWTGWVVIIPRAMIHLASLQVPLPDVYQVEREKTDAVDYGESGEHAFRKVYSDLEQSLLEKYNVETLDQLPVNLEGEKLLAAEAYTDRVYDEVMSKVDQIYTRQDRYVKNSMLVSPYLAMRSVSMSLAGADRLHHEYFYREAEKYRRLLVRTMNEYETEKKNTDQEFDAAKVWQLVPEFRYQFPKLIEVLHENLLPIIILLIWFLATGLWALPLPGRLSVREF